MAVPSRLGLDPGKPAIEHVPQPHKKSMDPEFLTRLADLRRQTDGTSSTNSTPQGSLFLLGSSASIMSPDFSDSFSIASPPLVVEFPPTPVFVDQTPPGVRKPELLSLAQTSEASTPRNLYPLRDSHRVIATAYVDNTHEVASTFTTSTQRQQLMKLPTSNRSVSHYAHNPMHYIPPRQTQISIQTTPPSNITQQPSNLTSASSTNSNPRPSLNQFKQGQPVEEQHTPWIWNPGRLEEEDDDSAPLSRRNSEPESFTSHLELKPTFSPSIVRTPQHYRDTPSPTLRHKDPTSIDFALSALMANLSTKPYLSRNPMPSLSSLSSSDPPIPTTFLSTQLSDQPDHMLSPLMIATTPKPLPPVSLHRNNGVRNNHPNPILATQSVDTIPEALPSYFHVASNDSSTHATPKPRPHDMGHYQQTQVPSLPHSQTDWQEVKQQQEREAEYREREQERAEREQRRQQRDLKEREQQERVERERRELRMGIGSRHTVTAYVDPYINTSTKHSPGHASPPSPTSGSTHPSPIPRSQIDWQEVKKQQEREAEYREREPERAEREQRRQQRDLKEREQQEQERVERERRELRMGIGSRHTVTAYVDPYINTSPKHSPGPASRPYPPSGSAPPSPTHYTPPHQVQAQITPPSGFATRHIISPTTTTTPRTNPLPPPPGPSNHIPLNTIPAPPATSTAASTSKTTTPSATEPYLPPPQGPAPPSYIYKTRHGYWNRRGDHLTPTGYLVYTPPHLANPYDLRTYPPENEGYMDHNGLYTAWCQRPELPASLPRMGKEPELPYEKFVVWVYK